LAVAAVLRPGRRTTHDEMGLEARLVTEVVQAPSADPTIEWSMMVVGVIRG
jgi:hypothetical protein